MKIWFDTEFIENGHSIDLISLGMVRDDGEVYYVENRDCKWSQADKWVQNNVFPKLHETEWSSYQKMVKYRIKNPNEYKHKKDIATDLIEFCGERPEFWAYYCSYDWVALCQVFGKMIDLPEHWPMYCNDLKQLQKMLLPDFRFQKQPNNEHNALADALWTKEAFYNLITEAQK